MLYLHLMDLQVILSAFLRAVMRLNLGVFQGNLMALKYYLFTVSMSCYLPGCLYFYLHLLLQQRYSN